MDSTDVFSGLGVPIKLKNPDDFLKIAETLTRIGIPSYRTQSLMQSCNVLHKRGSYAIMHFKEMYILDGCYNTLSEEDIARRNTIAFLLEEWGLLTIIDPTRFESEQMGRYAIKIISFKEKEEWNLCPKYLIGKDTRKR